jgi:hypothetical protein
LPAVSAAVVRVERHLTKAPELLQRLQRHHRADARLIDDFPGVTGVVTPTIAELHELFLDQPLEHDVFRTSAH